MIKIYPYINAGNNLMYFYSTPKNPKPELFKKMGLEEKGRNAIGILTITPGEGTIIAADIASKAAGIEIGFVDRFSGVLLITGDVICRGIFFTQCY